MERAKVYRDLLQYGLPNQRAISFNTKIQLIKDIQSGAMGLSELPPTRAFFIKQDAENPDLFIEPDAENKVWSKEELDKEHKKNPQNIWFTFMHPNHHDKNNSKGFTLDLNA